MKFPSMGEDETQGCCWPPVARLTANPTSIECLKYIQSRSVGSFVPAPLYRAVPSTILSDVSGLGRVGNHCPFRRSRFARPPPADRKPRPPKGCCDRHPVLRG